MRWRKSRGANCVFAWVLGGRVILRSWLPLTIASFENSVGNPAFPAFTTSCRAPGIGSKSTDMATWRRPPKWLRDWQDKNCSLVSTNLEILNRPEHRPVFCFGGIRPRSGRDLAGFTLIFNGHADIQHIQ